MFSTFPEAHFFVLWRSGCFGAFSVAMEGCSAGFLGLELQGKEKKWLNGTPWGSLCWVTFSLLCEGLTEAASKKKSLFGLLVLQGFQPIVVDSIGAGTQGIGSNCHHRRWQSDRVLVWHSLPPVFLRAHSETLAHSMGGPHYPLSYISGSSQSYISSGILNSVKSAMKSSFPQELFPSEEILVSIALQKCQPMSASCSELCFLRLSSFS